MLLFRGIDRPQKVLRPEEVVVRKAFSENKRIPGLDASPLHLLNEGFNFKTLPTADPLTPMYVLDSKFRILDWNQALSLAFDQTMEGIDGKVYWSGLTFGQL